MPPVRVPAGTVTFLFTDLEGSTRLWQERPDAMHKALARHDELLRHAIETHTGFVVKTMGDGFHAAFAAAHQAVEAAVAAQRAIEAEPWTETGPLHVRMGVHSGPVEVRDGDYYGTTVNRAARLMGVAHGGQLVCSQATAELVRDDLADDVALVDLGEHRLRDLARPVAIHQIVALGLRREFPPLRSLDNAPTNLPVQPTALVGRQALIAELASLLEREPLVTLTGVGGVGKTRLAVEVGAEVLPRYPDGVWVVELAPLAHDEMVLQTIADVLGVAAQTSEPLVTTLLGRLRSKRLLIVIDNCEHVLDPVARFVDRLASTASDVRVLATSREPLGVSAERVRAVPPLVDRAEAVELFFERAQHAGAVIEGREQLAAVGDICARLDGIPLAIELAAARARMMAPTQIAERLGQRFRLLTGGGRTAVERHRTLQATVSWSYELLDETERVVFERLSTFAGSFGLDAAERVAAGGEIEEFEVLDALGHLVDKSMVLAEAGQGGVRYRLLETLRQFAADRLATCADAVDVQDRHAAYFRERAQLLGRSAGEAGQASVLDDLEVDLDNYRTAFGHLLSTGRVRDAATGLLAMYAYWQIRRPREGLRWHHRLLGHTELDARTRLNVLGFVAMAETQAVGNLAAGERHAREAVGLAETAGVDPPWGSLMALTYVAQDRADVPAYRSWVDRCQTVSERAGDTYRVLLSQVMWYMVGTDDETGEMLPRLERLAAEIDRLGDPLLQCLLELGTATIFYRASRYDEARAHARAALDERAGPSAYCGALFNAAAIELLSGGDLVWGAEQLAGSLRVARDEGLTGSAVKIVRVAAAFAVARGDVEAAAVLLAASDHHATMLGGVHEEISTACAAQARAVVDATDANVTAARSRGEALTFDDLISCALDELFANARPLG